MTGAVYQTKPIDREQNAYFLLTVTAEDHGKPQKIVLNNALLNITVGDVDDNDPIFNKSMYTFNVSEVCLPVCFYYLK